MHVTLIMMVIVVMMVVVTGCGRVLFQMCSLLLYLGIQPCKPLVHAGAAFRGSS